MENEKVFRLATFEYKSVCIKCTDMDIALDYTMDVAMRINQCNLE